MERLESFIKSSTFFQNEVVEMIKYLLILVKGGSRLAVTLAEYVSLISTLILHLQLAS